MPNGVQQGLAALQASSGPGFVPGLVVVLLAVISGLATFLILTNMTPLPPRNDVVVGVLLINGVLIYAMLGLVAWQVRELVRAWQRKVPGARLHVRIVLLFSLVAALPAILIAIAASTTFSRALDNWFTSRTRTIVESSIAVAQAYVEEHGQVIRAEILSMARDLDGAAPGTRNDPKNLRGLLVVQAGLRNMPAAFLIDPSGKAITSAILDDRITYTAPAPEAIAQALAGQTALMHSPETSRIGAVTRVASYPNTLLYVVRGISPQVVGYLTKARSNIDEYERLRRSRSGLTAAHTIMYSLISLTALLVAIWCGLWFAGRFVAPIQRLILAAQQVSAGNLDVALPERRGEGDLRRLSQTFNRMTVDLKTQHQNLETANAQLNQRRAFMEAVLTGVSAGVIGLDPSGVVTIANRSAERLLKRRASDIVGKTLSEALPAFAPYLTAADHPIEQTTLEVAGEERTFAVQMTALDEGTAGAIYGRVLTFDDITDLVDAQRSSAWGDVARRIAHEIKNPLTPIGLAAERLKRKYGASITTDRDTFEKLTDTISRQVDNLKEMVNSFANVGEMPKPQLSPCDLREPVEGTAILYRESHPNVDFTVDIPSAKVAAIADSKQVAQALTNLVKNAIEATQSVMSAPDRPADYRGHVWVSLRETETGFAIEVIDNGIGLPKNRVRLTEPYVTTKTKGTGIGLNVVRKIAEQHGGTLALEDAPLIPGRSRGALVRITLPREAKAQRNTSGLSHRAAAE